MTAHGATRVRRTSPEFTSWWDLGFPAFRAELQKVFKRDIPVNERDRWEEWLANCQAEHREWTEAIIQLETLLNERVYTLFGLTAEAVAIVEESTKYRYGEV